MADVFDSAVRVRALNAAHKLRADQVEYLNTTINKNTSSVDLEEAYEKQTGMLLEPVILRYWIQTGKIKTSPVIKVGNQL